MVARCAVATDLAFAAEGRFCMTHPTCGTQDRQRVAFKAGVWAAGEVASVRRADGPL